MGKSPLRLLRTTAITGSIVGLAATAHVGAGGALPAPVIMVAVLAITAVPVMLLSRRRITTPVMLALLAATQFALHTLFDRASASAATGAPSTIGGHHHAAVELGGTTAAHAHASDPAMLLLHAAATLATALLLARGEHALHTALEWLRPLIALPTPTRLPAVARLATNTTDDVVVPVWRSLRLPALRGPPSQPRVKLS